MTMRKLLQLIENAAYDMGHHDIEAQAYPAKDFQAKGRADTKMRNTGRYGDNAMADPAEPCAALEEDDHSSTLDRLHQMLTDAGVSDNEIKAGIDLTERGKQKVAAALGVAASEIGMLIASLVTSMKQEDRRLGEAADGEASLARFSYEPDALGNVTLRDAVSGRELYLQGSQASQLLKRLKGSMGDEQGLLSGYQSMMEDAPPEAAGAEDPPEEGKVPADQGFAAAINQSEGSYNFDWHIDGRNGFGNVRFSGPPDRPVLKLVRVTDRDGNEFAPDAKMHAKLLKAAHDYMIKA